MPFLNTESQAEPQSKKEKRMDNKNNSSADPTHTYATYCRIMQTLTSMSTDFIHSGTSTSATHLLDSIHS